MRIFLIVPMLLAASACNVDKDGNTVTVQYDQNTAEEAVADASNTAGDIASDIGNDVERTADKIDNTDVDVDTDVNVENKQQ